MRGRIGARDVTRALLVLRSKAAQSPACRRPSTQVLTMLFACLCLKSMTSLTIPIFYYGKHLSGLTTLPTITEPAPLRGDALIINITATLHYKARPFQLHAASAKV